MRPAQLRAVQKPPKADGWAGVAKRLAAAEGAMRMTVADVDVLESTALLARARRLMTVLKSAQKSPEVERAARLLNGAAEAAARELRRARVQGDAAEDAERMEDAQKQKREPTIAEQISEWVKLASVATGLFGGAMSFFMLYLLYEMFLKHRR